jgi:hypothetical protein
MGACTLPPFGGGQGCCADAPILFLVTQMGLGSRNVTERQNRHRWDPKFPPIPIGGTIRWVPYFLRAYPPPEDRQAWDPDFRGIPRGMGPAAEGTREGRDRRGVGEASQAKPISSPVAAPECGHTPPEGSAPPSRRHRGRAVRRKRGRSDVEAESQDRAIRNNGLRSQGKAGRGNARAFPNLLNIRPITHQGLNPASNA